MKKPKIKGVLVSMETGNVIIKLTSDTVDAVGYVLGKGIKNFKDMGIETAVDQEAVRLASIFKSHLRKLRF